MPSFALRAPAERLMRIVLTAISENAAQLGRQTSHAFDETGGTIGRSASCTWRLPDPTNTLSSRHATVAYDGHGFTVLDTSMNGVYVNTVDEPVGRGNTQLLRSGDLLYLADYVLAVEIVEDAHEQRNRLGLGATSSPVAQGRLPPLPASPPLAAASNGAAARSDHPPNGSHVPMPAQDFPAGRFDAGHANGIGPGLHASAHAAVSQGSGPLAAAGDGWPAGGPQPGFGWLPPNGASLPRSFNRAQTPGPFDGLPPNGSAHDHAARGADPLGSLFGELPGPRAAQAIPPVDLGVPPTPSAASLPPIAPAPVPAPVPAPPVAGGSFIPDDIFADLVPARPGTGLPPPAPATPQVTIPAQPLAAPATPLPTASPAPGAPVPFSGGEPAVSQAPSERNASVLRPGRPPLSDRLSADMVDLRPAGQGAADSLGGLDPVAVLRRRGSLREGAALPGDETVLPGRRPAPAAPSAMQGAGPPLMQAAMQAAMPASMPASMPGSMPPFAANGLSSTMPLPGSMQGMPSQPGPVEVAPQGARGSAEMDGFLTALGLDPASLSPEARTAALEQAGLALRAAIGGLASILSARSSLKGELRMEQTTLRATENNPLKFSQSLQDILNQTLVRRPPGFLSLSQAVEDGVRDVQAHEMATVVAMQAAMKALLDAVGPDAIESKTSGRLGLGSDKARRWDHYAELHGRMVQGLQDFNQSVAGRAFAEAYAAQIERLRMRGGQ